jgi:hypothetical protein
VSETSPFLRELHTPELATEHDNILEFKPIVENYAVVPIQEAFDWQGILQTITEQRNLAPDFPFYLADFPSKRLPGVDETALHEFDHHAHLEALKSPALIYYFKGEKDEEGNCRSFCLWMDSDEAWRVSRGPKHTAAVNAADGMYEAPFGPKRFLVHLSDSGEAIFLPQERDGELLISSGGID